MASLNESALLSGSWRRCVALLLSLSLLMMGSTQASRKLQTAQPQLRLQAYGDNTDTPMHAPPAQSYLVSDGSWVDCVPIEGQIAAHHPSLKVHIIKLRPSVLPNIRSSLRAELHPQLFAREYGGCPDGHIPVQRIDPNRPYMQKDRPPQAPEASPAAAGIHEYAITNMPNIPGAYIGTAAFLSVNDPYVANTSEFSLSQFWVTAGSYTDKSLCTIEVGWQKYPQRHKGDADYAPHLFVFWTADAYQKLSCYDLQCPGFVHVDQSWVIGGAMPSYSTLKELQNGITSEVAIRVLYDTNDRVWWLYLDDVPIGYWPASIFGSKYLQGTAAKVEWGGEVYIEKWNNTAHSKTAMGSGLFPTAGYPTSAYFRNITYAYAKSGFTDLDANVTFLKGAMFRDDPNCYNIAVQQKNYSNWGSYFFFGGSGGSNPACKVKP
ncbi:protein neprosin [Physcomitrium patens]|uniref:Neprosin PEP catalytic domain-containing protein n=1 Tax=Physcomitrium patens TaxID=3218 RepID=A0A2K1KWR4_PHYPA|nr:uncharacterized protein LOC112279521 [Physcomitrium patens]PNR58211.1 hypothetical protein PHYPA_005206 [Physcomitrium patens]|eukprot:XP_024369811.1 uncharacterized protein LOC112279521 [Physcomitrella patens]